MGSFWVVPLLHSVSDMIIHSLQTRTSKSSCSSAHSYGDNHADVDSL